MDGNRTYVFFFFLLLLFVFLYFFTGNINPYPLHKIAYIIQTGLSRVLLGNTYSFLFHFTRHYWITILNIRKKKTKHKQEIEVARTTVAGKITQ